jgi:hypothetical protein
VTFEVLVANKHQSASVGNIDEVGLVGEDSEAQQQFSQKLCFTFKQG